MSETCLFRLCFVTHFSFPTYQSIFLTFVLNMSIEKQSDSAVTNSKYKRIIQILWVLVLAPIIGVTTLVFGIALFADLPDIEELTNPESNLATVAYCSDGKELGRFYLENRVTTHYKDIDLDVIHALVATEDERYYEHSGVDGKSLARVF